MTSLPPPTPHEPRPGDAGLRPVLRVVRGNPDDAELAALTAVLATAASEPAPEKPAGRSRWADPAARRRQPLRPGPGAWRSSGLPG